MDNQKQELLQKLRDANNVLVTVSANPSVDQLAACIGLTLLLNKLNKHATAVFSGQVPSTLEFLKPDETLEKNTDSLRDFIVSLDKSKADKLRYKVEDNVVKIFITPYKTSITEADLNFSQGDFNIDAVVCLGVEKQADLDQAITSHGRILHDATVISVSVGAASEIGTLNWVEPQASSLSEITTQIAEDIGKTEIDGQIATSFLTGIVAETDRFSNEKTSPTTMQLSAQLMAAGANQQLVANQLQAEAKPFVPNDQANDNAEAPSDDEVTVDQDGTLEIGHKPDGNDAEDTPDDQPSAEAPENPDQPDSPQDDSGADGQAPPSADTPTDEKPGDTPTEQPPAGPGTPNEPAEQLNEAPASRLVLQPPSLGGQLTANSVPESFDPSVDPLSLLNTDAPMLNHPTSTVDDTTAQDDAVTVPPPDEAPDEAADTNEPLMDLPAPAPSSELPVAEPLTLTPSPTDELPLSPPVDSGEKSLVELEQAVDSPHLHSDMDVPIDAATTPAPTGDLDAIRDAVMDAANSGPTNSLPQATQAVGSEGYLKVQDLPDSTTEENVPTAPPPPPPPSLTIPTADPTPPTSVSEPASTAPPVPPPLPLDPTQFLPPKQ